MKKVLSLALSLIMLLSMTAGMNLTALAGIRSVSYVFDEESGCLTIDGSGDANLESFENAIPREKYQMITRVEVGSGIQNVSLSIFTIGLYNVTSISVDSENPWLDSRDDCNAIIETESDILIRGCRTTVIPDTVKIIGESAFDSSMDSAYMETAWDTFVAENHREPSDEEGSELMANAPKGTIDMVIPEGVTEIRERAFFECYDLGNIQLPSTLTTIEQGAFVGCLMDSLIIPKNLTEINQSAFLGCRVFSLTVAEGNARYDSRNNCNAIIETDTNTLITGCINTVLPDGITHIGPAAFWYCWGLHNMVVPEGVTSIGECAFDACHSLNNITLPKSIIRIAESAFNDCTALADVYYAGSEEEWKKITINNNDNGNECLLNAAIHYNYGAPCKHVWDNGTVTTPATCIAEGIKTYTCTKCGETKTESIDKAAHQWNDGVVTTPATETAEGVKTYTCTVCNAMKTETISKLSAQSQENQQGNQPSQDNQQPTDTQAKQQVKLSLKKVAVKKSAKKLVLQATLKIDGKAVKGKKVTFKFNGKKYTAKTNKKGIAKVTVKKSVLKKLKKGKKITYSAKYGKKTVKKTVKVK